MSTPHSEAFFIKAYPAETTEAFFGGVPWSILYDNTTIAVAKICGDGKLGSSNCSGVTPVTAIAQGAGRI